MFSKSSTSFQIINTFTTSFNLNSTASLSVEIAIIVE